jgi:hypothetical protein
MSVETNEPPEADVVQSVEQGTGWTNSYAVAVINAQRWLKNMRTNGFRDVELVLPGKLCTDDGPGLTLWAFEVRHTVTRVVVELQIHGVDNEPAYRRDMLGWPRVYWDGSSSSDPGLADFEASGFCKVQTFEPIG